MRLIHSSVFLSLLKEVIALVVVLAQQQHHVSYSRINLVPDAVAPHCHRHCSFY